MQFSLPLNLRFADSFKIESRFFPQRFEVAI